MAVLGCERGRDPARSHGSTVVMAVPDVDAVKPDRWDLDFLTFLPLAKRNARGELEGHLARSWEHSPDHREYTFHLRSQLHWDDGVPVSAHDVKSTLDLLGHPDVAQYSGIEATVFDDSTVRIRARNPEYITDISYFPRHRLERLDPEGFWEWDFWLQPVGNGPFRFVRYVPHTLMEFEANPRYFAGKPRVERLILKFVGEAGLTELLAGNVDIAEASFAQIPRIAADPRFQVYHSVRAGARAIYWKADHPLFADPLVRRALTLALDRRELLQTLNLPAELPITEGVLTVRQLRRGQWPEPLPYDPEAARALLDSAGWRDRDGDGLRERGGRPAEFTATVSNLQGLPQLAVSVQAQLRRVGVRMQIRHFEEGSMWERLRAGDFEAWMYIHQPGADAVRRDFGRGNSLGYRNEQVFDLIDRLAATADPEETDRLYAGLTAIFRADQPFTRLLPGTRTWFVHRRVRGLSTPFQADPDTFMETLWVEEPGQVTRPGP